MFRLGLSVTGGTCCICLTNDKPLKPASPVPMLMDARDDRGQPDMIADSTNDTFLPENNAKRDVRWNTTHVSEADPGIHKLCIIRHTRQTALLGNYMSTSYKAVIFLNSSYFLRYSNFRKLCWTCNDKQTTLLFTPANSPKYKPAYVTLTRTLPPTVAPTLYISK